MSRDTKGTILVAPHHFPDLDREHALAREFGYDLVAATDPDAFRRGLPEAQIVMITPYARITADDFPAMKKCRAVIRYGIGYDNIDVDAATEAGIPVSIVPGTASEEVASHAFAMDWHSRAGCRRATPRSGSWVGAAPSATTLRCCPSSRSEWSVSGASGSTSPGCTPRSEPGCAPTTRS